MVSGGWRSHGSQAIGDGLIRCPKTLPQIKKRLSSSDLEIMPCARSAELAVAVSYTNSLTFPPLHCVWSVDDYNANKECCVAGNG